MFKRIVVVVAIVSASACASKYSVQPRPAPDAEISISGKSFVSVPAKGPWVWRESPEDTVKALVGYAGNVEQVYRACEEKLAKTAAQCPASAAPIVVSSPTAAAVEKSTDAAVAK